MSIRSRNLLLVLGVLCLAMVESACENKPTESSDDGSSYCEQNPENCQTLRAR